MRIRLGLLVAAALFLAVPGAITARADDPAVRAGIDLPPLIARLMPAVVNISILRPRPAPDGTPANPDAEMTNPIREFGTGFIISPDGYIVTNRHVVAHAYKATVTFADGRSAPVRVIATNDRPDLALLKVDVDRQLPTVPWGNSDKLVQGDTVLAIGNPLGLSSTATVGIVSALNRDVGESLFDTFIQTDAAINHGNSGGPLFNMQGQVVGVNWALLSPTDTGGSIGLGLAIPAKIASYVIGHMREKGRFHPGWIGITTQPVSPEIAQVVGRDTLSGAIVATVVPGGPAAKAGLRASDLILGMNGIAASDARAVSRLIAAIAPGGTEKLSVWRDGKAQTIDVTVGEWPNDDTNPVGAPVPLASGRKMVTANLGLRGSDVTEALRKQYDLPANQKGVVVLGVAPNSAGADAGFAAGDVVVEIAGHAINNQADVAAAVTKLQEAGTRMVLVLVQGPRGTRWIASPIPPKS